MAIEARSAADIVVENKEDFVAVFPELEKPIGMLLGSKERPGCTKCQSNKYKRDILSTIMLTDKQDRDVTRLMIHQDPQLLGALTYQPKPDEPRPAPDASMPKLPPIKPMPVIQDPPATAGDSLDEVRTGCPDCVCKHLSQALILTDEIVQGYPEHVKLALDHTKRAIAFSTGRNKKVHNLLKELQGSFEGILKEEESNHTPEFHLARARAIIKEIVDGDNRPLAIWRVIGHMGEAADECVQDNPQLATRIREERLSLMEDPMYRPPLAKLLNDARKGR